MKSFRLILAVMLMGAPFIQAFDAAPVVGDIAQTVVAQGAQQAVKSGWFSSMSALKVLSSCGACVAGAWRALPKEVKIGLGIGAAAAASYGMYRAGKSLIDKHASDAMRERCNAVDKIVKEAAVKGKKMILPMAACATLGYYGYKGAYMGIASQVGNGVENMMFGGFNNTMNWVNVLLLMPAAALAQADEETTKALVAQLKKAVMPLMAGGGVAVGSFALANSIPAVRALLINRPWIPLAAAATAGAACALLPGAKGSSGDNFKIEEFTSGSAAQEFAGDVSREVADVVDQLQDPARFKDFGIEMPRGIIMYGPPGCGKTMTARAVAQQCNCEFIAVNATKLLGKYVGHTAPIIMELFKTAREAASDTRKVMIFIDEIDGIASKRQSGAHQSYFEGLTTLLDEMDGFKKEANKNIFVFAATNRLDMLDDGIFSRFDTKVSLGLPDEPTRQNVLAFHLTKIRNVSVNIPELVRQTDGWNNRELHDWVARSGRVAAVQRAHELTQEHFIQTYREIMASKGAAAPAAARSDAQPAVAGLRPVALAGGIPASGARRSGLPTAIGGGGQ